MKIGRRRFLAGTAGAAALLTGAGVRAQTAYPSRPIRLVIPFPPGGAFDFVGRLWAEKAKSALGTVVVENIGGGGSSLGASAVVRAAPDGYTLLLGGTQTHVNEALLKSKPLYEPAKDLEPVTGIAAYFLAFAVHPGVPARNLADLVARAKAEPGKMSYGHAGVGSIQHLTGELFKSKTGTPDIVQVPYRGTGPVITDVISGQIPLGILGITGQVLELHSSGKLRLIAVTSAKRLSAAPDIPTAAESGFPDMTVTGSIGLLAPARTPSFVLEQVSKATRTTLEEPGYRKLLNEAAMEAIPDQSPEQWQRTLARDIEFWTPVVKALGLKID